jgi:hypothetical protein
MMRLLLIEFRRLVPSFILFYLFSFLAFFLYEISFYLLMIPAICVFVSNQRLKRSSWYLILPWSRTKVICAVVLQSLFILSVNLAIVALVFTVEGKLFFGENKDLLWLALIGYLAVFIFSLFRSLSGIQLRKPDSWSKLFEKKAIWRFVCYSLGAGVVWHFDMFLEPTFLVLFYLLLLFGIFSSLYKEFVLPGSTSRTTNRVTAFLCAFLFCILTGSAIVASNWNIAGKYYTVEAISFLKRFPSFVSEQRAVYLFTKTDIGPSPTMERHLKSLHKNISGEIWQTRTLACKSENCLDLSSDVAKTDLLSPSEIEDRFLVLMNFCEFQIGESGRNNCIKRKRIDEKRMKSWLTLLEKEGSLRKWLVSGDSKKQIIALKGIPFAIDADQEKYIRELGESTDPRIKTAATLFLQNSQIYKKLGLNCDSEKDQKHAVCKFKNNEYSM